MYEGQDKMDTCHIVKGGCYYDGSGLRAEEWYDIFLKEGVKMDVSDYYLSPGTMIYQKTIERNIAHIRWAQGINEVPWRDSALHLNPIKDFDKIREIYAR